MALKKDQLQNLDVQDTKKFWAEQASRLLWRKPFSTVLEGSLFAGNVRWFEDGELNASENCIDRHLDLHANKVALIWEGNEPPDKKKPIRKITYQELHDSVCKFAHLLEKKGVKKGDRVCIYMPLIPEAIFAMLACARMGAIHSVVFGGFSAEALAHRIEDAKASCVITANGAYRGEKLIHFKANVDTALNLLTSSIVNSVIVLNHVSLKVPMKPGFDVDYQEAVASQPSQYSPISMGSSEPLFILYTSGSTGKPKGIVHGTGGYLTYVSFTYQYIFGLSQNPYWCTADIGWITGHSYGVYGPLSHAQTVLIYEGTPEYPTPSRCWEIIDRHNVEVFYTAPTLIRALMRYGQEPLKNSKLNSLKLLGSVGEPINPDSWEWYKTYVGHDQCPIMDTWWQTETGGILMAPPKDLSQQKPGSTMRSCPGIKINLMNKNHEIIEGEGQGDLVVSEPWPGMLQGVYGNPLKFEATYLNPHPGHYTSGDGAHRDKDGDIWITGRLDDVLNISGHRLGTSEIESALDSHPSVVEAAVVGFPHEVKGEAIYAYVTLLKGVMPSTEMKQELIQAVRQQIGPIATPEFIQFAEVLPKTRSGKIMRRILRSIAKGNFENLGDISTLADMSCVDDLIRHSHAYLNVNKLDKKDEE
jgi:acetyl-CoA synthetase